MLPNKRNLVKTVFTGRLPSNCVIHPSKIRFPVLSGLNDLADLSDDMLIRPA